MKVSLIIPVYNEEKHIRACLDSLSKQTYKNLEIIVIDDGSTDKSKAKIQKLKIQLKNQKLTLLEQKHGGAGKARNLGAAKATGKILVFVDADMTFTTSFVEKLVTPIVAGTTKGTFSKEELLANDSNPWAVCWNINRGLPVNKMHPDNYPSEQPVFRAILKSEFDRVGGFDVSKGYTDDWSLSDKLGYLAKNTPGAIFYHHNPDSLQSVFIQSKWMGKREYKNWILALIRVSLPFSLFMGVFKSCIYGRLSFLPFKIVSDFGVFIGILGKVLAGKVAK